MLWVDPPSAPPEFAPLWRIEFGAGKVDDDLAPLVLSAADAIRTTCQPIEAGKASDTLVTEVLLGTLGCISACDRFFIDDLKAAGLKYSYLNVSFISRLLGFTQDNLPALRAEQFRIELRTGVRYPLMKLVDMHFWQLASERAGSARHVQHAS
jgi:hypothetical protein